MAISSDKSSPGGMQSGDPRLIMRWARRYAKSRTISFLVQWVVIVVMVSVVGAAAGLTNMAHRMGNDGLFYTAVATMVFAMLILTWFSVSRWGGDLIWRVTQWLYGDEGYVAYFDDRDDEPTPLWITALGGGLVVYHLAGALLVSFNVLSLQHMQPFSAAYMAPFLALMIVYQGLGFWAWFWPIFYGLHAILLLAGVMPSFQGQLLLLNMIVPVFGYGLVAILIGHAYSRVALWQLRRLAQSGLDDVPAEEDYSGEGAP